MLLYVHIPFCRKKCRYCSFVSYEGQEFQTQRYIELLLKETELRKNEFVENVGSIFIGGGTPSLLSPESLLRLADKLNDFALLDKAAEFTIESNPGTVTEQWMAAAAKSGMNRLSLGMQALQPELLEVLGRIHSFKDVENTVRTARDFGISNINIDLIFGVPGQTLKHWKETLDAALSLKPTHISAYGLIPEENTPLYNDLQSGLLTLPDPDLERIMYDTAISVLSGHGLRQYEISNFSIPGFECRHNIGYWTQIPYVGLGVSAASMAVLSSGKNGMCCRRTTNTHSLSEYEQMIYGNVKPVAEDSLISPAEARFETMMLGLRMNNGVDTDRFFNMHGVSVEEVYGERLRRLKTQNLLFYSDHCWRLTRRGFDIQNSILVELMDD